MKSPSLSPELESAIAWSVRLSSDQATEDDRSKFLRWLHVAPAHEEAWGLLSRSMSSFGIAGLEQTKRGSLASVALSHGATRRKALTALIGIIGGGAIGSSIVDRFIPLEDLTADQLTRTGQRKTLELPDGGLLTMGPRTAVDLDFETGQRRVLLRQGEILVKRGSNPTETLQVRLGDVTLHARGGIFGLSTYGRVARIAALDTPASVTGPADPLLLAGGESVEFERGAIKRSAVDATEELAWERGLLIIRSKSLTYAVERLRPYFPGFIRLDPSIAATPVTGVLPLSDVHVAIDTLTAALDLSVGAAGPFWISIGPPLVKPA